MSSEKVLALIEQSADYVSGEWLSEQLGISRTAVWKHIQTLRQRGYTFEAVPRLGYRLAGKPEMLDEARLQAMLATRAFGRSLRIFRELSSTQQYAHTWIREGGREGGVVVAETQTAGKGRMGRGWISPSGKGLWFSMILEPRINVVNVPQLTLLAAVALCRSLRQETGLDVGIKWPNDLLIHGKKISGILLESIAEDERLQYVVAGIGLNANVSPDDIPNDLKDKITSLKIESDRHHDREKLLAGFLLEWETLYALYLREGFDVIRVLWESHSVTLNRRVTIATPEGDVTGRAVRLDDRGGLVLALDDGSQKTVYAGDVHLRATE